MIPLRVDRPLKSTPWVNYALIGMNIFIFLLVGLLPAESQNWIASQFNLWPKAFVFTDHGVLVHASPHLWQFITSTFLHGGFWHIAGNMLFLWVFGNVVEDKLGHFRYLLFYLAGGIFSGLGHCLASSNPALGASGAIAAVMGAFLIFFPRTNVRILWFFILISIFDIPSIWFIGFFIAQNIWMQLQPGNQGVAYMAHLTGTFAGIAIALLLLWLRVYVREPYDVMSWISQWNRRRQFRVVSRQGFDPWQGRTAKSTSVYKNTSDKSTTTGDNTHKHPTTTNSPSADDTTSLRQTELRQAVHQAVADGAMNEAAKKYLLLIHEFPDALLNENDQLAIANHAFAEHDYPTAERMYRDLLKNYPGIDTQGEVRLMLGLTLARYLDRAKEAEPILEEALKRMSEGENADLAQSLLRDINQTRSNDDMG